MHIWTALAFEKGMRRWTNSMEALSCSSMTCSSSPMPWPVCADTHTTDCLPAATVATCGDSHTFAKQIVTHRDFKQSRIPLWSRSSCLRPFKHAMKRYRLHGSHEHSAEQLRLSGQNGRRLEHDFMWDELASFPSIYGTFALV